MAPRRPSARASRACGAGRRRAFQQSAAGSRLPWRGLPGRRRRASAERTSPVDRENVGAGVGHGFEQVAASVHVEDDRCSGPPDSGDRARGGGQRPLAVVLGRELAGPGVEELDRARRPRRSGRTARRPRRRRARSRRLRAGRRDRGAIIALIDREAARAAAFDEIGGERPGSAAEAEDGRAEIADLAGEAAEDLAGERDRDRPDRTGRASRRPRRSGRARAATVRRRRTRRAPPSPPPGRGCRRRR